jgi:hypothetical protein
MMPAATRERAFFVPNSDVRTLESEDIMLDIRMAKSHLRKRIMTAQQVHMKMAVRICSFA